jgi:uncharacterized metal-binding protein YceD (DUF177 family)
MKSTVKPEFSRPLLIARLPAGGSTEKLEADAKELVFLAKRLDLPALHNLRALLKVSRWRGGGLKITGRIDIDLTQVSVISLEEFRQTDTFPVELYFLPQGVASTDDDVGTISNGEIDLGEVVTETVALELDPYPRKEGESFEGFDDDAKSAD